MAQENKRNWIWCARTVVITVKRLLREDWLVTQPEPLEASQGGSAEGGSWMVVMERERVERLQDTRNGANCVSDAREGKRRAYE
jgi:hypothetical protein